RIRLKIDRAHQIVDVRARLGNIARLHRRHLPDRFATEFLLQAFHDMRYFDAAVVAAVEDPPGRRMPGDGTRSHTDSGDDPAPVPETSHGCIGATSPLALRPSFFSRHSTTWVTSTVRFLPMLKIRQGAECLEKELGRKAIREMAPMQPGDVSETRADIDDL